MPGSRKAVIAPALLLACLALALGACGGDDDDTVTVEQTATETTGEGTETAATETTVESGGNTGPGHFVTPSGNIGCVIGAGQARCDISQRSWKPTPPPEPCPVDYGQGIQVGSAEAAFVCAGDTSLGGPATLGYGQSSRRGPLLCVSSQDGVTCTNTSTGSGFFISRQSYQLF